MRNRIVLLSLIAMAGLCLPILFAPQANAFHLVLANESKLAPQSATSITRFFTEVESKLPPAMKSVLPNKIIVEVTKLQGGNPTLPSCTDPHSRKTARVTLGDTNGKRIRLSELLLAEIVAGENSSRRFACGHGDYYRQAVATLIHELGHLYDLQNFHPDKFREMRDWCISSTQPNSPPPGGCEKYIAIDRTISKDPYYLNLAGWTETGLVFRERSQQNQLLTRSPDAYEYTSPEEHFAVNLEYFLMDPEYACRRPSLHTYLSQHFQFDPFSDRKCRVAIQALVQKTVGGNLHLELAKLSPKRLYQVHYLLAGAGTESMSRWGHSMYRLVFCAPERTEMGPECLKDIAHHLVVSFRAAVSDARVDTWKGMMGGYPSQLFILPLIQVINEYADTELRDLKSLSINLNDAEKTRFLLRLIELQWEYRGSYRFLSNNCATESWNLLRSVLTRADVQEHAAGTPEGIWDLLVDLKVSQPPFPSLDAQTLEQNGLLFRSRRTIYEKMFAALAEGLTEFRDTYPDLESFMTRSTPEQRLAFYQLMAKGQPTERVRSLSGRFYVLEDFFRRRIELEIKDAAAELSLAIESGRIQDPTLKALALEMGAARRHALDDVFSGATTAGYGLPLSSEMNESIVATVIDRNLKTYGEIAKRADASFRQYFTKEFALARAIERNRMVFASGYH